MVIFMYDLNSFIAEIRLSTNNALKIEFRFALDNQSFDNFLEFFL